MKQIQDRLRTFFGLATFAAFIYLLGVVGLSYKAESAKKLEVLWREDIQQLSDKRKLPPSWNDIRIVEKVAGNGDLTADQWRKSVSAPVEINTSGHYKLEILFLSQTDDGHELAVIQHHMIHIQTGNSVWELGRTYNLD